MGRIALLLTIGGSMLLAACDNEAPEEPRKQIVVRSAEQDQLHQLDDLNRAIGLKRAIYASGYRCRRVTQSGYVQEHGNLSMWTASCDDGKQWAIFVGPDGSAQVRRCEEMSRFDLPACQIKGSPKPAAS